MTGRQLVTAAMILTGEVDRSQPIDVDLLKDGLEAMNEMLASWSATPPGIFFVTRSSLTFTASTSEYTIGSGGDFNESRPQFVMDSFLTISDSDYDVKVIKREEYDAIPDKTVEGIPDRVYYEPNFPLGYLRFYPVPDDTYSLTLNSQKPFSTYVLADTISLPPGYLRAIKYNLAVEMAPSLGVQAPPEVAAIAAGALRGIFSQNMANLVAPIRGLDPIRGRRGQTSIRELFS